MTYVIIHALAPVSITMLSGPWAGRAGVVDSKNVSLLSILVMDFALPATLLGATIQMPQADVVAQSPPVLVLTSAMWIIYAAIYFPAISVFKHAPQDAVVLTLTITLPNYVTLGLLILGNVLDEGASISLSVVASIAHGSVLMTPFCLLILEREKTRAAGGNSGSTLAMLSVLMWRSVKKPTVWSPLPGAVLSVVGVKISEILLASIRSLGLAATVVALFLTGAIPSVRKLQLNTLIAISTIVKLLVQPSIAWGLVILLGLHGSIATTMILIIVLATNLLGAAFSSRFGVQPPDAEAVLLSSSVLRILLPPLFISLTPGL